MNQFKFLPAAAMAAAAGICTLQGAALAARYDALCGGAGCSIGVTADGISAQGVTIPAHRVTSWSMGGNSETDVALGAVTTFVFGLPGLLGFGAKKHDYNVSISGYDENGKKANISFQFVNDKPAKRIASQLPSVTGLGINQSRTLEEIVAYEQGRRSETELGRVGSLPTGLNRQGVGGPSLPTSQLRTTQQSSEVKLGKVGEIAQATQPRNCWSAYLDGNPAMKVWADANPALAEKKKADYAAC